MFRVPERHIEQHADLVKHKVVLLPGMIDRTQRILSSQQARAIRRQNEIGLTVSENICNPFNNYSSMTIKTQIYQQALRHKCLFP